MSLVSGKRADRPLAAMDAVRARQFAIWKRMTLAERWALIGDVIGTGLAVREQRLRAQHPDATQDELRLLRRKMLLADCADRAAP